jgi:carbon-monoxide dehydrogenase medium subunit
MKPAKFDYIRPANLSEVVKALSDPSLDAKISAGSQSLGPMLNLRLARPQTLIDIRHVPELRRFEMDSDSALVGATWTHSEIEDGVIQDFTGGFLRFVASGIAYRAVRNRGTMGGSLSHADPAADWVSAVSALGGSIHLIGPDGLRRVATDGFVQGTFLPDLKSGEVLTSIEFPRLSDAANWGYYKVCRKTGEFAKAIGASILDQSRGISRVLAGAVDGPPVLLTQTSKDLAERGVDVARATVRQELEASLPHLDSLHLQQAAVAVERSLALLSNGKGN